MRTELDIRAVLFSVGFLLVNLTGCTSIGPGTVARDRFDYSTSISDSWKRQTLLNIVKLRYLDPPIFVDVGQIVSGYSLESGVNVGGQISSHNAIQGNALTLGGAARFVDRPTVTYVPLTGNKFVKGLMTPLSPESVFFTIQSGWPADGVLFAAAASLNGLKNQETSIGGVAPPDPDFLRVLALLRKVQLSGAVGMRVMQDTQKRETSLLTFRTENISPETLADIRELRRLMRLDPEASDFKLVFGGTPANNKEVAIITRSLLHLMQTMASQIEVPQEDLAKTRAVPGWESVERPDANRLVKIQSSDRKPGNDFVAINYRNYWFWIDDSDLKSKRAFAFMMMLFTLADSGERENLPLVTIPAQ
ncbi:MAG TPA: hypothetical protein VM735_10125 [Candidatus Kapabacteria bacterium]|nr:hypothetical protein [Candidatus Kapabacteria bacterium]